MRLFCKIVLLAATAAGSLQVLSAQDLSPRAYVITPLHSNAVTLTYSFYDGSLFFNGALPITGATGTYSVPIFTYYHSFGFFGHAANVNGSLPYAVGTFQGQLVGQNKQLYRSGLLDSTFRFSVNLKGGPAMEPRNFVKWKQKTLLGVSLKVVVPTGQYSPTKLINGGKPLGVQAGVWLFRALGTLGARRLRRSLVLHHQSAVLFAANAQSSERRTDRFLRRAPEL